MIYQCCLERDLSLFDAGDLTEVGEKGLTLRSARDPLLFKVIRILTPMLKWWSEGDLHMEHHEVPYLTNYLGSCDVSPRDLLEG